MEVFLEGWESGAAEVNSMFRKCQHDWTTVSKVFHRHTLIRYVKLRLFIFTI